MVSEQIRIERLPMKRTLTRTGEQSVPSSSKIWTTGK